MVPILFFAAWAALPDQGIFADLDDKVRITAPTWRLHADAAWLRVDAVHGVLTVYQGDAPAVAYRVAAAAGVRTVADALLQLGRSLFV